MAIGADTLDGWLAALEQLHPTPIELGLARIRAVAEKMELLQMPCPLVTVAGTNGKGSTVTYLDAIYRSAGYKSCCQFSPHMLRFNERIRLNGVDATDEQILQALGEVEAARGDISLTYFEYTVLAAVWLYQRAEPDVIILEVGLGGRLDACNIWDCDAAIVTNVDVDHQRWLGDNREAIGGEKAAIARAGRPAITGDQAPPESLISSWKNLGADIARIGHEFKLETPSPGELWRYSSEQVSLQLPMPGLAGSWQLNNAACAVTAVLALQDRLPVQPQHIAQGLQQAHIDGRFQRGKIGGIDVVMDVGHNPDAARRLAEQLQASNVTGKTFAVSAVMADKDAAAMLQPLNSCFDAWFLGGLEIDRAMKPADYQVHVQRQSNAECLCFDALEQALDAALARAGRDDRVVVFGSFYTVAELIPRFDPQ